MRKIDQLIREDPGNGPRPLPAAESRYRTLVEELPAVTYVAELDELATIRYVSPQVEDLLGYPPERFIAEPTLWAELVHPDDRERFLAGERHRHDTLQPFECEYRMRAVDGREVAVWDREVVVRDVDGEPACTQGVVMDITPLKAAEVALKDSEEHHRSIIAAMDEGVVVLDAEAYVIDCNPAAARIMSVDASAVIGKQAPFIPAEDLFLEDGTPVTPENSPARRALSTGKPEQGLVMRVVRASDGERLFSVSFQPLFNNDGERPSGLVWSVVDITEHREAERAIRESEARKAAILKAALDCIVTMDGRGRVVDFNPAAERTFGYTEAEVVGREMAELIIPPALRDQHRRGLARYLESGETHVLGKRIEISAMRADGSEFPVELTITRIELEGEPGFTGYLRDITERKQQEEEIAHLAYHDQLTGLPNRSLLEEHLDVALARAHRNYDALAVLYLDLDNFKLVNDSLGHVAGDEVLGMVADRLRQAVRETDLLARQGGDEFLLLLTDLSGNGRDVAETVAEKIFVALEEPFSVGDAEFQIGASIGISIYPRSGETAEALLKAADAAMYQAKSAGRGHVSLYMPDESDPRERLSTITRLRKALAQDEFTLWYQPIITLATGKVAGLEALIRWEAPGEGLLLPARFVSLAEDTGLIEPIGAWVIEAFCRQARAWRDEGLGASISFNLSPRQLRPQLAETIGEAMARYRLDPSTLTAEITESTAMAEADRDNSLLMELRRLGLDIAVDDFGAGYSSLGRLRDLPVQQLKIDRSFLRDVPADPKAAVIMGGIIELADGLGMTVVAEGVETEEQLRFLVDRGCPLAQGYHLGRPVPAEEATALLRG